MMKAMPHTLTPYKKKIFWRIEGVLYENEGKEIEVVDAENEGVENAVLPPEKKNISYGILAP